MFEPGLMVTRSVGPPGVSGPAATPAVASRLVTSGEPPGSTRTARSRRDRGRRAAKRAVAPVVQDAHLAGQLVGDDQVEVAVAAGVDRLDVGDARADGDDHRRQERLVEVWSEKLPMLVVAEDRQRAVAGVADDQVVPAVAGEVGRDDLRR